MKLIAVMTSTGSPEEARRIAAGLVERKLAACVQISTIESFFEWEHATQCDDEYRVFAKTTDERYPEVEAAILEMHSYELPAIYAFAIEHAYEPYANWVASHSRESSD